MGPAFDEWNAIKLNTDHPGVTYLVDVGNSMRDELLAELAAQKAQRCETCENYRCLHGGHWGRCDDSISYPSPHESCSRWTAREEAP